MKLDPSKFKKVHGYEEGKDVLDPESVAKALDYKKLFLKQFVAINQTQIESRLGGDMYYVTWKYNGEYAIIFYQSGLGAVTVNRSGRTRRGIPCIDEAGELLKKAGVKQAIIPAEIYVDENLTKGKNGVHELLSVLANEKKIDSLRLAAFDILELDNQTWKPQNTFADTIDKLNELFQGGQKVIASRMKKAVTPFRVLEIFNQWVSKEGAEGVVVRSNLPFIYKIKPRHSIDLAVVGFAEGTGDEKGRVRSLLTAFVTPEGRYQVIGRVGSGIGDKLGKELYKKLSKKVIPSEFIETDPNSVAFQMVDPDTVIELTVNDLIAETPDGPKVNPVIEIKDGKYHIISRVEGVSFVAPVFVRVRDDKKVDPDDVRISQIENFTSETEDSDVQPQPANADLPKSKILIRDVYRKTIGQKIMVLKFLVWQTNKKDAGFPGYVLHITNYSSQRLDPLQREVYITDNPSQLNELYRKAIEENIKKGWEKISEFHDKEVLKKKTSSKQAKS